MNSDFEQKSLFKKKIAPLSYMNFFLLFNANSNELIFFKVVGKLSFKFTQLNVPTVYHFINLNQ